MESIRALAFCSLAIGICTRADSNVQDSCFCKLYGEVDDCSCKVESVDSFNNKKIYPILQSVVKKEFFRYFKVNLNKECPFWVDDSKCAMKDCHVNKCKESEIPESLKSSDKEQKRNNNSKNKYSESSQRDGKCEEDSDLGNLDTTISDKTREDIKTWTAHDEAKDLFCQIDDEDSTELSYVDLLLNPERFTGYTGVSTQRIWRSIYEENCFRAAPSSLSGYGASSGKSVEGMCLEKRVFFRMVSGLHTSINIHLSANYFMPAKNCYEKGTWGPNYEEFHRRFDPKQTYGRGPQFLKNLYFTYLVELKALAKVAPYLEKQTFYTGNEVEDKDVINAIRSLLEVVKSFPDEHFDESRLFQGDPSQANQLKEEFRSHFLNISRIMDCVGCDKCKLWGKLQVQGMGTALKILFSGDTIGPNSTTSQFHLKRTEIVTLINAFARLSESIKEIDLFRRKLR